MAVCSGVALADDFRSQCEAVMRKLGPALKAAEKTAVEGKTEEGRAKLMALFPEPRTAPQNFMLGNVLYKQDPKGSYAMHKRAAESEPENDAVLWEWALEQHRAGEWAGAQATYKKYLKAHPDDSSAYGLLAECLIRQGKPQEASDVWKKSEDAPGSLERFEEMVFEVHGELPKFNERAALLAKVRAGDAGAAQNLVSLDSAWKEDWWNTNPRRESLAYDLKVIKEAKIPPSAGLNAAVCAAELASLAGDDDEEEPGAKRKGAGKHETAAAVLKRHGFLLDPAGTLPEHGGLLSIMLSKAMSQGGLSEEQARTKFADQVFEMAKKGKDAELFNAAANLAGAGTARLAEVDQAGWDATGDARFAASRLAGLGAKEKLTLGDPLLAKALSQFPEDAIIAGIAVRLAAKEGKPLQPYLISGIKAEYSHFSPQGMVFSRAGANTLRAYFAKLAGELKNAPAAAPAR
jgi:tetratricopeptide (TPR) repeat protein